MAQDSQQLFLRSVQDMLRLCTGRSALKTTQFLDEHQRALAEEMLRAQKDGDYRFFGGYSGAVRTVLCISGTGVPIDDGDFPIVPVLYTYREKDVLTHRDFLGSLMAQQIARSLVGDICVGAGKTCVLVHQNAAQIALSLQKVGRVGVRAQQGSDPDLFTQKTETFTAVITAPRLACVLAGALGGSRSGLKPIILSGQVALNHREVLSPSAQVAPGDVLSVRHRGKYIFCGVEGSTKKGRLLAVYKRYI